MSEEAVRRWNIEQLSPAHMKDSFSCGIPALDEYLKKYAFQNQKKNVGRTYVATKSHDSVVNGFYTLSTSSVAFVNLPRENQKGLPRYPVPVIHMGRLAVDNEARGFGLGSLLLADALKRIQRVATEVGVCGLEVYAKNADAKRFYAKHGFVELADDALHLYLSMRVIQQLFG